MKDNYKRLQKLRRDYENFEVLSDSESNEDYTQWEGNTTPAVKGDTSRLSPFSLTHLVEDSRKQRERKDKK